MKWLLLTFWNHYNASLVRLAVQPIGVFVLRWATNVIVQPAVVKVAKTSINL
jgi:hypothetical protein